MSTEVFMLTVVLLIDLLLPELSIKHFLRVIGGCLKQLKTGIAPSKLSLLLGRTQEGINFVGHKYLKECSRPIHFFTRAYKTPFVLRLIKRIENQKGKDPRIISPFIQYLLVLG